jgi:hypothetical protein
LEPYAEFQNPEHSKRVLADGIKKAYSPLFKAYPNAHELPKEKLEGYIKQQTGADPSVVAKIYGTIKRFCSHADFNLGNSSSPPTPIGSTSQAPTTVNSIPITMNIQIVIPSDATAEQYDKIFTSIKKNLLK